MTREEASKILQGLKMLSETERCEIALDMAIKALSAEPCREADDYENEIADLHNRLNIAEYDKERYKEEITTLEAENKGEWIPVSERLPENNDDVLVYDGSDIFVAWYSGINGNWGSADNRLDEYTPILAWMPLPEPYKAESEVAE